MGNNGLSGISPHLHNITISTEKHIAGSKIIITEELKKILDPKKSSIISWAANNSSLTKERKINKKIMTSWWAKANLWESRKVKWDLFCVSFRVMILLDFIEMINLLTLINIFEINNSQWKEIKIKWKVNGKSVNRFIQTFNHPTFSIFPEAHKR